MRVTYLQSATVVIEANGLRILTDPWLVDGEYYGSWAQYPPFEWTPGLLDDIDYIYISHIHPDHFSRATMARLPKSTPVLIHRYGTSFLKRNIEALGFEVRELAHNARVDLGRGVTINIAAADDCDPLLCGKFLGCAPLQAALGSAQIDTLCVIEDGRHVLVNANDCPYPLARRLLPRIRADYGGVDLLLTGYAGAGPYPQCFTRLSLDEKARAAAAKKLDFLNQGVNFVHGLAPRYVLPFAGQYTLAGRLSALNDVRGVPEVDEAAAFFAAHTERDGTRTILLNSKQHFDVASGSSSGDYAPARPDQKRTYQDQVLATRRFAYDDDPAPDGADLEAPLRAAFERAEAKRREFQVASPTTVYIDLSGGHFARVPMCGGALTIGDGPGADEQHVVFRTDLRLLKRILSGPSQAHWNNAEIGSHVEFERSPDVYERGLYHVMNYFHA